MMRAATALAGVLLVLIPVAANPRGVYAVAAIGLACALVTAWPRRGATAARRVSAAIRARARIAPADRGPDHTSRGLDQAGRGLDQAGRGPAPTGTEADEGVRAAAGTLVAIAVIIECALSRLDTAAMAAEGLLLLGFLLLLDRPAGLAGSTGRTWLRLRLPALLGGVAATGIVLAALAAVPGSSPWLALGGLAAAAAAYLVAAPRGGTGGSRRG